MPALINKLYKAGHKPFDLPLERLVASLRVALTAFCLLEFVTVSGLQFQHIAIFEMVLAPYIAFGLGVLLLPTVGKYRTGWQLPVHVIDIGIISIIMYSSQPMLPACFLLYVFVLLSATFRWNWRGALWTTAILLALQVIMFVTNGTISTQFFIQYIFLSVTGGMFAFFGASRARSEERLREIAAWPTTRAQAYTGIDAHWLDASLTHIASVFRVSRVLVIWEFAQEPYTCMALLSNGKCAQSRTQDDYFRNLVSPDLLAAPFAVENLRINECLTFDGTRRVVGPIVNRYVRDRFDILSVCSAPFTGDFCSGRVFMLDRSDWGDDDLALAQFVASRLRIEIDYFALSIQLQESTASRERIRLARDLHDGVLQNLAAASIQLKMISRRAGPKIEADIENIRKLLLGEQQSIRAFVVGRQLIDAQRCLNLHDEIKHEIRQIESRWPCALVLSVTPESSTFPVELILQIKFIIAEATANAVRHGNATRINVTISRTNTHLHLAIADNGIGLKISPGTYQVTDLATIGVGPQSIANRIAELNGALSFTSSPTGVELFIDLPCNDVLANDEIDIEKDEIGVEHAES